MTNLVVPLAEARTGCGGKAAHLAMLLGAGLPVPDGFALPHTAFAATVGDPGPVALDEVGHVVGEVARAIAEAPIPPALAREVESRAAALGRLAVRSSISIEDQASGGAPGIFASRVDVAPGDVWAAIRAVWASAVSPLAIAYARARGVSQVEIGVVIQRFVPGARTTIYTRAPGRTVEHAAWDEAWLERAGDPVERRPRSTDDARLRLALDAEAAISASAGADVELIEAATGPVLVQARPIRHAAVSDATRHGAPRAAPPAALFAFTRATPGVAWRWDAAHNPEPMSEAQSGLVDLVDDPGAFPVALPSASGGPIAPYRMRSVAGYLYACPRPPAPPSVTAPASADELAARWAPLDARMVAALDIASPPRDPTAMLLAALDAYLAFYRIWAHEVAPLLAVARAVLPARLAAAIGDRPRSERLAVALSGPRTTTVAARIAAAARGDLDDGALLTAIGDLAPAWDVAAPTFAEDPERVHAAVERARRRTTMAPLSASDAERAGAHAALGDELGSLLALARLAGDLSELDDVRFARAQRQVRQALRAAAPRGVAPDDVFWLPLDELAAGAALDPDTAAARAAAARAAACRAGTWAMPLAARDGEAVAAPPTAGLRGVGTGARVVGPVVRVVGPGAVPAGAIAVVRAVTPALALALDEAAAIVAEFGGILDHGAALARELGIPCVTGCAGAWEALPDGARVAVDGDAGTIELL